MHPAQVVEGKAATFAASVAFGTAAFAAFVAGSRPCGGWGEVLLLGRNHLGVLHLLLVVHRLRGHLAVHLHVGLLDWDVHTRLFGEEDFSLHVGDLV